VNPYTGLQGTPAPPARLFGTRRPGQRLRPWRHAAARTIVLL